jgi:CopA family copper-resistance protein
MRPPASRRTFVKGLAAGGVLAGLGLWPERATAQPGQTGTAPQLTGTDFELLIGEQPVNFTGALNTAHTVNGSLPAPTLRFREGDTVTLRVRNRLRRDQASIHWHGLLLPANMDGVPGLSFNGIEPGETYVYRFHIRQSGTYWYHSHSAFQEQLGLYGALIIEPRGPEPIPADREHVVLLSDWTDENPGRVFSKLKKQSDYYNFNQRTVGDFLSDVRTRGWRATMADRKAWGEMRMTPTDLADVSGATYTYLMNGTTPAGNWTGLFQPGERVRLRFINGAAMTYFDVRIPGLKMTVVAADGQPVHPVTVDEFRIAVAETLDVIVEPAGAEAFTIFAQSLDRTGFARGTLATRAGLDAPVPELDPRPLLTMDDMGHGMDHSGHTAPDSPPASQPAAAVDPHAGHVMPAPAPAAPASESHAGHSMPAAATTAADPHAGHGAPQTPPTSPDPHAGHVIPGAPSPSPVAAGASAGMVTHPPTERNNPLVDMQTMMPAPRLDDPGVGLRSNGRRVLTYADLRSTFADPDGREPGRTLELHLTGHMERFVWSFNGVKFSNAEPLRLTYGERLRIVLVNDTMMAHPIHLHGMWSDLEDAAGQFLVRKHTVDMPPGTRRSYRVTADALGRWAYHCHLLFHMEAGMFREVRVDEP